MLVDPVRWIGLMSKSQVNFSRFRPFCMDPQDLRMRFPIRLRWLGYPVASKFLAKLIRKYLPVKLKLGWHWESCQLSCRMIGFLTNLKRCKNTNNEFWVSNLRANSWDAMGRCSGLAPWRNSWQRIRAQWGLEKSEPLGKRPAPFRCRPKRWGPDDLFQSCLWSPWPG